MLRQSTRSRFAGVRELAWIGLAMRDQSHLLKRVPDVLADPPADALERSVGLIPALVLIGGPDAARLMRAIVARQAEGAGRISIDPADARALGRRVGSDYIPLFASWLDDPDRRDTGQAALSATPGAKSRELLVRELMQARDPSWAAQIVEELGRRGEPELLPVLEQYQQAPPPKARFGQGEAIQACFAAISQCVGDDPNLLPYLERAVCRLDSIGDGRIISAPPAVATPAGLRMLDRLLRRRGEGFLSKRPWSAAYAQRLRQPRTVSVKGGAATVFGELADRWHLPLRYHGGKHQVEFRAQRFPALTILQRLARQADAELVMEDGFVLHVRPAQSSGGRLGSIAGDSHELSRCWALHQIMNLRGGWARQMLDEFVHTEPDGPVKAQADAWVREGPPGLVGLGTRRSDTIVMGSQFLDALVSVLEQREGPTPPIPEPLRLGKDASPPVTPPNLQDWPLSTAAARAKQQTAAQRLGVPVRKAVGLPGGETVWLRLIPAGTFIMGAPAPVAPQPPAANPIWPHLGRLLMSALLVAIGVGVIGAAVRERRKPRVSLRTALSAMLGISLLLFTHSRVRAFDAEVRAFRTALAEWPDRWQRFCEAEDRGETPAHVVTISKSFYMSETEVTNAQWMSAMVDPSGQSTPSDPTWPHTSVSWEGARRFAQFISRQTGMTFRLPTEAEWEYACRAGTATRFASGDSLQALSRMANCSKEPIGVFAIDGRSLRFRPPPDPVAQRQANAWGLYDMHGNAVEWCADWYGDYTATAATDPTGPAWDSVVANQYQRVVRVGMWLDDPAQLSSSARQTQEPTRASGGIRLVMEVPGP
jgi:formylglycine-generating enzyme required for sulfatase activity